MDWGNLAARKIEEVGKNAEAGGTGGGGERARALSKSEFSGINRIICKRLKLSPVPPISGVKIQRLCKPPEPPHASRLISSKKATLRLAVEP